MAATLRDVAARCNLSPSLVSGVLNNRASTWASDETRRRVLRAAAEMGYRPNSAARALRSGKTKTVSLVYIRPQHPTRASGYSTVIEALAGALYAHEHQLLVQPLDDGAQVRDHLADLARTRLCDCVVLWGADREVEAQASHLEAIGGVPFVVKGRHEATHPEWPQVDFDHEAMMRIVVERMVALGRHRLAYLGYSHDEHYVRALQEGFQAAVRDVPGASTGDGLQFASSHYPAEGEAAITDWFDRPASEQPDALVIGASATAWEAAEYALARRGRRIGDRPGDVSVAGTSSSPLHLLFGQGYVFDVDFFGLAEAMCHQLLLPLLRGETLGANAVVRYVPTLLTTDSYHLIESGIVRFTPGSDPKLPHEGGGKS